MITFDDFLKVELRVARIVEARGFPEARKCAFIPHIDFGPEIGQRKSSVQITAFYRPDELVGRLVVALINFPPKQIGPFMSGASSASSGGLPRHRDGQDRDGGGWWRPRSWRGSSHRHGGCHGYNCSLAGWPFMPFPGPAPLPTGG